MSTFEILDTFQTPCEAFFCPHVAMEAFWRVILLQSSLTVPSPRQSIQKSGTCPRHSFPRKHRLRSLSTSLSMASVYYGDRGSRSFFPYFNYPSAGCG